MRNACKTGVTCAAFGAGLLAASIFPSEFVLALVALALVITGCSCAKKR